MESKPKILLADDDYSFSQVLKKRLEEYGFDITVCFDGEAAWKEFNRRITYNLCLLDVVMPKKDGFELAMKIRSINEDIPILFVASKSNERDIINAFKHGGDGWVTKPPNIQELICRIKVFLRRSKSVKPDTSPVLKVGNSIFNFPERILSDLQGNKTADLTKKTAIVLKYFCQNPNRIITRAELLYATWGKVDHFNSRSLDVFMTYIRKLFKDDNSVNLETLHGVGFRFNMP